MDTADTLSEHEPGKPTTVAAEIRCSRCRGDRGQSLIAVAFTNGDREWLMMSTQIKESPLADTPQEWQRVSLTELAFPDGDRTCGPTESQLDLLRDTKRHVVWDLEKPDQITDRWPLASVSCPRCAPTGQESSWFLDCRKIGLRLVPGRRVKLLADEVSQDGTDRPILDRDLGLRHTWEMHPMPWLIDDSD